MFPAGYDLITEHMPHPGRPRFCSQARPESLDQYLRRNVLRTETLICLSRHHTGNRRAEKRASCPLGTQVPDSVMLHCNAHSSLGSVAVCDILCCTTERSSQRCLSAVKQQTMAIIDQYQDLYDSDSLTTLRNTQGRGH